MKEAIKKVLAGNGHRIDKFLNSWISKKLTVFLIATSFIYLEKIDSIDWRDIAIVYIMTQGLNDIAKSIVSKRK